MRAVRVRVRLSEPEPRGLARQPLPHPPSPRRAAHAPRLSVLASRHVYMLTLPPILYISKHYIERVQMCMCYTGSVLASRQAHAESLRCATPEQLWMRELEALRPVLQAAIERP